MRLPWVRRRGTPERDRRCPSRSLGMRQAAEAGRGPLPRSGGVILLAAVASRSNRSGMFAHAVNVPRYCWLYSGPLC
jgi:hypothetical protein